MTDEDVKEPLRKRVERAIVDYAAGDTDILPKRILDEVQTVEERLKYIEGEATRVRMQRDDWRSIAELLIRVGFGMDMKGFGDYPPKELIDAIAGASDPRLPGDAKIAAELTALRTAMMGRAWKIGGRDGLGQCDYPLCQNRGHGMPLAGIELRGKPSDPRTVAPIVGGLKVCHRGECLVWGKWIQVRALSGTIIVEHNLRTHEDLF